jgi:hypothetical protein
MSDDPLLGSYMRYFTYIAEQVFRTSANGERARCNMTTARIRYFAAACVILLVIAVQYWRFFIGPGQMVEAIQHGDVRSISNLTRLTINPNSDAFLVGGFMHCAAASGQTQSMARLRDLGASVNRLDGYGATPLHVAVHSHRIESLRWLLANGVDVSIKDRDGHTAADYIQTDVPVQEQEIFVLEFKNASNKLLPPTRGSRFLSRSYGA